MAQSEDRKSPVRLRVLYEDNHLLGVEKPAGVLVQGDRTGDPTLLEAGRAYLKQKYDKPGNVFLGLVHRIDRPVSGVVLFARTSKAASRLTREFQMRRVEKTYLAVVVGRVAANEGRLEAFIKRTHLKSRIESGPGADAKPSVLSYRVLERKRDHTLLEVTPGTGRHHQIRLQLADMGHPVAGDLKYGAREPIPGRSIALHAAVLTVQHPTRDMQVRLAAAPPRSQPWRGFMPAIENHFR
ncbi:MAG: RluA family pseudouridine synthase [Candidatus Krumholzibacteriia bacterium]